MNVSEIIAVPFQWASAVTHRRVFHPVGVLAKGAIERVAPPGEGLPITSSFDVVGRVSKGLGTPDGLPDIIGLAFKMSPQPFAAIPWDVLLASAGSGLLTRFGLRPVTSWTGPVLSSMMPLRCHGDYWWLAARMITEIKEPGVSLDAVAGHIREGGIQFDIEQACGIGGFRPLARLTLNNVIPSDESHDVVFDPIIHTGPGVEPVPGWLVDLRRRAYGRSRQGRGAD